MLKIYVTSPTSEVFSDVRLAAKIETRFREIENLEMDKFEIIVCTCITSGDDRLRLRPFDAVVIDEAS